MKRGIIVDDAAIMRLKLREILQDRYYILSEAENGCEAVEQAIKLKPDFITMDITMAEMNGIDALQKIVSCCPDVKIIMVSAVATPSNVVQALKLGAKHFIKKPFESDKVLSVLASVFNNGAG